jgi:membrane-associated phospholipid phosphatase
VRETPGKAAGDRLRTTLLVLPWAVLVLLAAAVHVIGVLPGDEWVRQAVLARATPAWITLMRWVNLLGNWRVLVPAGPLLLVFPRVRRHWGIWLLVLVSAPALESLLKPVIGRPRPESLAFGFPSGHATASAACLAAFAYAAGDLAPVLRRVARALAVCLILLVGLARIVLHAHWPSDVLGGIALGLGCAGAAALISASRERRPAESTPPPGPSRDAPSPWHAGPR